MINKLFFNSNSILVIIFISLFFAIIKGSGFYGFGNDFYVIYKEHNLNFGSLFNRLGWIISTISLNKVHLGVHLTTFILSFSFGFLLRSTFQFNKLNNIVIFIMVMIVGIHTWPIIMSTSNAMRQGLCMSMIFFSLAFYNEKKILPSCLFLILSIFMHKSGPFVAFVFVFSSIIFNLKNKINISINIFFILMGLIIFIISFFLVNFFETGSRDSRIIFKDYRYHFMIIGISYLILAYYKNNFLMKNFMNVFVYFYIFATFPVFLLKLNFEYERLMMMFLIPIIFTIGTIFNKRSSYIFYILSFSSLLFLTIFNGMYDSFI